MLWQIYYFLFCVSLPRFKWLYLCFYRIFDLLTWQRSNNSDRFFNHVSCLLSFNCAFVDTILIKQGWWLIKITSISHWFTSLNILWSIWMRLIILILIFTFRIRWNILKRISYIIITFLWIFNLVYFIISRIFLVRNTRFTLSKW